jgi:Spy/CpxP family protein refolding chaperone
MKKKLLIILLAVVTLFNITAIVTFGYYRFVGRPPFPPPFRDDPGMGPYHDVGLDESQMSRLQAARDEFFERTRPIADSLHRMRMEMFQMLRAEAVDTVAVFALIDNIGTLQNTLQKDAISHILAEGPILTREQKERLFNMFEGYMGKRWDGERGGRRRGPFGGMRDDQNPRRPDIPGEGFLFPGAGFPNFDPRTMDIWPDMAFRGGVGMFNSINPILGPGRQDSICIFHIGGNFNRNLRRY